jgi:putative flippase GtrA
MGPSLDSLMRDGPAAASRPAVGASLLAFLIVGGLATLGFIGLSTLMIGLKTGVPDWLMSALCYAALIIPAYLGHKAHSFRSEAPHHVAFPRYVMVQLTAIGLSAIFSLIFYNVLHTATPIAAFLVAVLTAGVNFVVLRAWAFAHRG